MSAYLRRVRLYEDTDPNTLTNTGGSCLGIGFSTNIEIRSSSKRIYAKRLVTADLCTLQYLLHNECNSPPGIFKVLILWVHAYRRIVQPGLWREDTDHTGLTGSCCKHSNRDKETKTLLMDLYSAGCMHHASNVLQI